MHLHIYIAPTAPFSFPAFELPQSAWASEGHITWTDLFITFIYSQEGRVSMNYENVGIGVPLGYG